MAPQFIDDKSPICIPFILNRLSLHQQASSSSSSSSDNKNHPPPPPPRPLIIGLNGLQGVGKSTLVAPLAEALASQGVPTLVCSIDDFYLTHEEQVKLARENPDNALWQVRGEPGTHDIPLLKSVLTSLLAHAPTSIPQYDKALFSGQGDRLPPHLWKHVNTSNPLQVVILEGWCIGFRPLSASAVSQKHSSPSRTLQNHRLEHLLAVNEKLREYDDVINSLLDALIHIDAEDTEYVYEWRLEQEEHLRLARGDPNAGMTKEQVVKFVDAYYPAYELYSEGLREGLFKDRPGAQLRMVVGRDRKVKQVVTI
ncbi:P-loop containing nucleoside triphosphate hydrolase protein [Trichoderma citrinoviride]|uniref:P-loop containing nucleoside triphosphate hydrolase protein n=1 Tax=Trichoderma citrinoviride TaxID=58853 RepID=A0A2T4BNG1_9HYPO|nr:P-loop containing nucleoside triphosphate hydrolase protein [Trichoderma citrinoviride]PTB70865.1 P-loop containing nucleoside triphosphate hydrolase protein [Trichoderma citrinoviride]